MYPPLPVQTPDSQDTARRVVAQLQRSEIFRDYQRAFESTTGLPLALRASGSFNPPLRGSRHANPFCALMAATNKSCAACLQLQHQVEAGAVSEPKTLQCFAGLNESAIPLRIGDRILGHLQTGQVFLQRPSKTQFDGLIRQINQWGIAVDPSRIEAAFFQTRVIARKQYESIVRLVEIFSRQLASLSNQVIVSEAHAELPAVARARAFMVSHHSEDISLAEVARSAGMSAFYFCKVFKRVTGVTFTDYLARTRVESVKTMLLNPHARMSEAAYAAGFQSLSQFNRVFHRIAGEPPSSYHDRLHRPARLNSGAQPVAHAA